MQAYPHSIEHIVGEAGAWCAANGLLVAQKDGPGLNSFVPSHNRTNCDGFAAGFAPAPVALLPTKLPKNLYEQAAGIQTDFNLLVDRISRDTKFLQETLAT